MDDEADDGEVVDCESPPMTADEPSVAFDGEPPNDLEQPANDREKPARKGRFSWIGAWASRKAARTASIAWSAGASAISGVSRLTDVAIRKARSEMVKIVERKYDNAKKKSRENLTGDPYMPGPVRYLIASLFDAIEPDVRFELMTIVGNALGTSKAPTRQLRSLTGEAPAHLWCPQCGCLHRARAAVRYALRPFDRTVWQQTRGWPFWVVLALRAAPGVQAFTYLAILLVIDRKDEHQLVTLVLEFKRFQFFTTGLLQLLGGVAGYYRCVSLGSACGARAYVVGESTRMSVLIGWTSIIGFVLQILVAWCALRGERRARALFRRV